MMSSSDGPDPLDKDEEDLDLPEDGLVGCIFRITIFADSPDQALGKNTSKCARQQVRFGAHVQK